MIHPARRIPIPFFGYLLIERFNTWYGHPVTHSPKKWPWWKFFSIVPVPTMGIGSYNVWTYTRKDAICVHVIVVRERLWEIDDTWPLAVLALVLFYIVVYFAVTLLTIGGVL